MKRWIQLSKMSPESGTEFKLYAVYVNKAFQGVLTPYKDLNRGLTSRQG